MAKLKLSAIEDTTANSETFLSAATVHIDDALGRLRSIGKDLMPVTLDHKGLLSALEEFFESLNESKNIIIDYTLPVIKKDLQLNTEIHIYIYRIVQEVVNNTIKRSRATKIFFNLLIQ